MMLYHWEPGVSSFFLGQQAKIPLFALREMPTLNIQVNVDESDHNAVLWYETEAAGVGRETGQTVTKTKIVYAKVVPDMVTYFHESDGLVSVLRGSTDPNVKRAILYSTDGFGHRSRIKKETEQRVERWSLWLCCATCCCAVCWAKCCPKIDRGVDQLNEHTYSAKIAEEFPENCETINYDFRRS